EVPPTTSPGTGTGSILLSADHSTITINSSFSGLQGNATLAHLHNAPAGQRGPVIFPFTGVPQATSGTIPEQSFAISPALVDQLLRGNFYENIHSTVDAGGEIRGQFAGSASSATATVLEADVLTATGTDVTAAEAVTFSNTQVATFTDANTANTASDFTAT